MAYFIRKLRPPVVSPELISGISVVVVFGLLILFWGVKPAFAFVAAVEYMVAVLLLLQFLNTKNIYLLILTFVLLFIGIFLTLIAIYGLDARPKILKGFSTLVMGSVVLVIILNYNRKLKWRSRELLELAAMPVNETMNGFTNRPYSVGKIDCSSHALHSFADFISRNLIAITIKDGRRFVFSLDNSMGARAGLKKNYKDDTWVSFDEEGNILVNISHNDYMKYRDSYSFDQLCDSLGQLFVEFFEQYRKGEGYRVIERLNSLKLNVIIE